MFRDLEEFFDSSLRLPIRGKTYVIASPDAKTGLWVQSMLTVAARAKTGEDIDDETLSALQLDDDEEKDLFRRLLGDTFTQMVDDKLPWEAIKHAGTTAIVWTASGIEAAEAYWHTGGTAPKAPRVPQDRKASAKSGRPASPASSSSKKKAAKGKARPGRTS